MKFISTKLSTGKRVQELETIRLAIEKKVNLMNYLKEEMKNPKVTVLSLAPMLAKIIEHVEMGLPLTYVYDMFTNKI